MLGPENRQNSLVRIVSTEALQRADGPIVLAELGKGSPIVVVTAAMHGDEEVGVHVLDDLKSRLDVQKGTVRLVIANPPALGRRTRFIAEDLNRAFPGEAGVRGERGLATRVLGAVADSDYAIDLHTTSTYTHPFTIVGARDKNRVGLAETTGVERILYIPRERNYAMADFVRCGIGIELGTHGTRAAFSTGVQAIENTLRYLGVIAGEPLSVSRHQYFELFGRVEYPKLRHAFVKPHIRNFDLVQEGDIIANVPPEGESMLAFLEAYDIRATEDFYPVFVGERSYKDLICLKAKRIAREEIRGEHV